MTPTSTPNLRAFLGRNVAYTFAGRALNILFMALVSIAAARSMSLADFRVFSVSLAVVIMGGVLASFGLGSVVVKRFVEIRCAHGDSAAGYFFERVFVIALVVSVAIGTASFFALEQFGRMLFAVELSTHLNLCLALGITVRGLQIVYSESGRATGNLAIANLWGGITGGPIYAAGMLLFFSFSQLFPADLDSAIVYSTAINCLITFIAFQLFRISYKPAKEAGNENVSNLIAFGSIASLAVQFAATEFLMNAHGNLDTILTSTIPEEQDGALYIAARRLVQIATVPAVIANVAAVGILARMRLNTEATRLSMLMQAIATAAFLVSLPVAALLVTVPEWILSVIYGAEYENAASLCRILIAGQLVYILTGPCMQVLMQTNSFSYSLLLSGVAVLGLLIFGPYVCVKFGSTGLAWLSSISAVTSNVGGLMLCRVKEGISTHVSPAKLIQLARSL